MGREARRVEVADPRHPDGHLRLSWHSARQTLVVSHWRNGVCVATTPVAVAEIPAMIGLLATALQDAATIGPEHAPSVASIRREVAALLRGWTRPHRVPGRRVHPAPPTPIRPGATGETESV